MIKAPGSASPQSMTTDPPAAGGEQISVRRSTPPQAGEASADQLRYAAVAWPSQVVGLAITLFLQSQQYRLVQHKVVPADFLFCIFVDDGKRCRTAGGPC